MRTKLSHLLVSVTLALPLAPIALHAEDNREVVRSQENGQVLGNSFGYCVRTQWSSPGDPCAPPKTEVVNTVTPAPAPVSARSLERDARTVYFEFDHAALNADATTRLNHMAEVIKGDAEVKQARIVGFADRMGSEQYNEKLSQKRAENVRNYLTGRGVITANTTETRWFGEAEPKTQCPDSLKRKALIECLQKDRRVEVEIDYYPEGQHR